MARRPSPARPPATAPVGRGRLMAPFALTWRQVLAVWLMGMGILVLASWRVMPHQTEAAGRILGHQGQRAWTFALAHADRRWPSWIPALMPRPKGWPGYDPKLAPPPPPMAKPKPKPSPTPPPADLNSL